MSYPIQPAPIRKGIKWDAVPFRLLEVGQAVLIPREDIIAAFGSYRTQKLSPNVSAWGKRLGRKFSLSKRPEGCYLIREA